MYHNVYYCGILYFNRKEIDNMETVSIRISKKTSSKLMDTSRKTGRIARDLADKAITYVIDNDLVNTIYKESDKSN